MPREGGYGRSTKAEWLKTSRTLYGEAIRSAEEMGLELEVWLGDAITFHTYRCQQEQLKEQYNRDCKLAAEQRKPTPLADDYRPRGPKPEMSQPGPGQSNGPSRSFRR